MTKSKSDLDINRRRPLRVLKISLTMFVMLAFLVVASYWQAQVASGAAGQESTADGKNLEADQVVTLDPAAYLPLILSPNNMPILFGQVHAGEGTYYYATGEGNCLFPASPENMMVAAMNNTDYGNADLCGAFVSVTGPKGSVMVRIVDRCPECPKGDVDLSLEAFPFIADVHLGRVPITWQLVSPPLEGPIVYHFKNGSNQWWTAVQIRNHRNPIAKFEYQLGNGSFKEVSRTMYNYFVESSGMGLGPYTFRVTDVFGNTITNSGIPHIENGSVNGSAQFPPPP